MIVFSIMMWFCSAIVIILSISLLKGNYSGLHGKVFDNTEDKEKYAKAIGKPALLMGTGIAMDGILAVVLQGLLSILISIFVLLLLIFIASIWIAKIQRGNIR